ncbi:MAG TPA: DUF5916 domain-containing protein [Gammaproteobacteria bacterium]|jgi:hypothetical protein
MKGEKAVEAAVLVLWLCVASSGHAQNAVEIASCCTRDVPRTTEDIEIDGFLDEPAWSEALVLELTTETYPRENRPALVQTHAYLLEDGSQFLIAFDARDPNPEEIRAYLRDRDTAYNDDMVGVIIDTFNDERRAFEFLVNALGVQMDLTNDDINRAEDDSWDAIWESVGRIDENGYIVEIAIPFSQLRFPRYDGTQTWGIDVVRFHPRLDRARISINPLERGRNCYLCQLTKITGFAGAEPGRDLEIVPSLVVSRIDKRDEPATDPLVDGDPSIELGINLRWGITPDVTANIAVNPDFSQVEADVPQLDINNQFALLFPESRPFFLEGADFFSTPINTVFTRNIAFPDFGAKLTGRRGNHTFGLFATNDDVTNLLFPGPLSSDTESFEWTSDAFVGRYSLGLGNASALGALVTSRSGDDYSNDVIGLDGRFRINDSHNVRFQYLTTKTQYPLDIAEDFEQPTEPIEGDAVNLRYAFSSREWFANAVYERLDPGFRADMGFVPRVGIDEVVSHVERIWHGTDDNRWNRIDWGGNLGRVEQHDDQLLNSFVNTFFAVHGPMQSLLRMTVARRQQFWDGTLYDARNFFTFSQIQPRGGLLFTFFARTGDQVDFDNSRLGKELRLIPTMEWNANRRLLLRLQHTSLKLDTQNGEKIFDAQLTDFRLTWQFNLRSFMRLTMQRQDIERNLNLYDDPDENARTLSIGAQLLYSYKLNPQTVFFLGYSDNHKEDDDISSLIQTDRDVFMKLSYAWTP